MRKESHVVIGMSFGDEGKGKVVSWLCNDPSREPLVIRYCGGQQAGHHVIFRNKDHVFSNFGSGSLHDVPSYFMPTCTIDPVGIRNEFKILEAMDIYPVLIIDPDCPVTTVYDKIQNFTESRYIDNGTCGVGVGATFQREEDFYHLKAGDLRYENVLKFKLESIKYEYYKIRKSYEEELKFYDAVKWLYYEPRIIIPVDTDNYFYYNLGTRYDDFIFEGSQGLLLDQHYGFFPNVTRSNTGTKNIVDNIFLQPDTTIWLVTRAYQTRHGNGPMTNEDLDFKIKENPYEQNFDDGQQGVFRKTMLDLDMLMYGVQQDKGLKNRKCNLVITCLDLMQEYKLTYKGKVEKFSSESEYINTIQKAIRIAIGKSDMKVYLSRSPFSHEMERFI